MTLRNRAAKMGDIIVEGGLLACQNCGPGLFRSVIYPSL